jgi:hypothetical protein
MRYWLKREWNVLLSKDTFMLELFLLFYSLTYALVWIWPSETFSLDAYQWLRGIIDETTLGVIVFCVSELEEDELEDESEVLSFTSFKSQATLYVGLNKLLCSALFNSASIAAANISELLFFIFSSKKFCI